MCIATAPDASFTIKLGLYEPNACARDSPQIQQQGNPKRKVLIVEDNHDAADSLRDVLELDGHAVEVAYSGFDGIAKAREFKPEVVFCDIGLPGMDGFEVARTLRADVALTGICLIALSGYALSEDQQRAHEVGFDLHLPKPPNLEKVQDIVATIPLRSTGVSGAGSLASG